MTVPNLTELVCLHSCNCEYCISDLSYKCMHCDCLVISSNLKFYSDCDCSLTPKIIEERAILAAEILNIDTDNESNDDSNNSQE